MPFQPPQATVRAPFPAPPPSPSVSPARNALRALATRRDAFFKMENALRDTLESLQIEFGDQKDESEGFLQHKDQQVAGVEARLLVQPTRRTKKVALRQESAFVRGSSLQQEDVTFDRLEAQCETQEEQVEDLRVVNQPTEAQIKDSGRCHKYMNPVHGPLVPHRDVFEIEVVIE